MRVVMTGGGTAGHINPALAVAAALVAERDEVLFVGTPAGLESTLVPKAGVSFRALPASGYDRSRPLTALTATAVILASTVRALRLLGRERPDVVACFGAFVSVPVGLAAVMRRIPLVVHEQNSVPGLANRLLSRWAHTVCVTYPSSIGLLKGRRTIVTGNPVRDEVLAGDRDRGRAELGIGADETMLLVFGGSRGARHLNEALLGLSGRLSAVPSLRIEHVAGPAEAASVRERLASQGSPPWWRVHDYLDRMGDVLAASDLVVARAGATSIAEITALGKPAILVPYPYATDDHQTRNADELAQRGAAVLIRDQELDGSRFGDVLLELLSDPGRRATMAAASAELGHRDASVLVSQAIAEAAKHSPERGS